MFFSVSMHPNQVLITVLSTLELDATFSFFDLSHVTHKSPYLVVPLPKIVTDPENPKGAFTSES